MKYENMSKKKTVGKIRITCFTNGLTSSEYKFIFFFTKKNFLLQPLYFLALRISV